jgi:two-component system response regulator AtoC
MTGRVLVVDDDPDMCRLLSAGLAKRGFEVTWRTSGSEALALAASVELDAIVTDLDMAGMNGLELCERIVASCPDVPIAMLTAFGSMDTAIAAMRAGACDFVTKPPEMDVLAHAVERVVRHRTLRDQLKRLPIAADENLGLDGILSISPVMRTVAQTLTRVSDSEASVLITGESGTGKELVARALHRRGRRSAGPFVAINCAAVPEALIESELFGHVRGAFTDAHTERMGLFVRASGGTLFLDEIGALPLSLQPKLLRALQERVVRPVGADDEIACDVRLITATNHDLESAVRQRSFREDLYFRINVVHIDLPPLRARGSDVLLLAQHFIERHAANAGKAVMGLSPAAAERLLAYPWPGNVRELQNCVERAVAFARFERIVVDDLPEEMRRCRRTRPLSGVANPADLLTLEEVERHHILRVMEAVRGSRTVAAQALGLNRKTLYRKLLRYGRN